MSELTPQQELDLQKLDKIEINPDDWEDLCRAVIVRAIFDYALYGYHGDTNKEKKIHDKAKYWLFNETNELLVFANGANLSIGFIRKTSQILRQKVINGEFLSQREKEDLEVKGQLTMLELWSNMNA